MSPKLKKFIQTWVINTLAVLVAVYIVPGIRLRDNSPEARLFAACMISFVLGILNSFIRPILLLLALPLLIFTLGLFMFVINALLLYLVGIVLQAHFEVDGFWPAFWGAFIISVTTVVLNSLTGSGSARIEIRRGPRPPPGSGPGGDGPVIDV